MWLPRSNRPGRAYLREENRSSQKTLAPVRDRGFIALNSRDSRASSDRSLKKGRLLCRPSLLCHSKSFELLAFDLNLLRLAIAACFFAHHPGASAVAVFAGDVIAEAAQPATKPLRHLVTGAPEARLERVFGDAKFLGGFPGR